MERKVVKKENVENEFLKQRQEFRKSTFQSDKSAEHRLELVDVIHGVEYINDSVCVDINATWNSLERLQKKIIWIAGGASKNNDYSELHGIVKEKVRAIICFGDEQTNLLKAFHNDAKVVLNANSITEAVFTANKLAEENECVLFSPACPSYGEFESYEKRGQAFKAEVSKLKWGGL
jgi:UDP-N-acetylmuramoylalanine--D-glutamate ligase